MVFSFTSRFKKEKVAAVRTAKLRLSNLKLEVLNKKNSSNIFLMMDGLSMMLKKYGEMLSA